MSPFNSFIRSSFRYLTHKNLFYLMIAVILLISLWAIIATYSHRIVPFKVYHIGQDPQWSGINLMGKDRNVTAFADELLLAIAKEEGLLFHIAGGESTERLMNQLEQGELDAILSSLTPDFQNTDTFVFSDPFLLFGPVLIVPRSANLSSGRKIIAMQKNSATLVGLEKDPSIQIQLYDNILPALADLDNHRIDGVLFPLLATYIYMNAFFPNHFRIATPPLTNEGLRLVALKSEKGQHLIHHFNQGLITLKDNGVYRQLIDKWELISID